MFVTDLVIQLIIGRISKSSTVIGQVENYVSNHKPSLGKPSTVIGQVEVTNQKLTVMTTVFPS